jgi:predicted protein tyrosine phosphatase
VFKRIQVLSRRLAERHDPEERFVLISITDPPPFGGPAKIQQRWGLQDILRLEFYDFGEEVPCERPGWMSDEHARQIWSFVQKWQDQVDLLVIHCEAGASRSPSVAFSIADALDLSRLVVKWGCLNSYCQPPNMHVYDAVMRNRSAA